MRVGERCGVTQQRGACAFAFSAFGLRAPELTRCRALQASSRRVSRGAALSGSLARRRRLSARRHGTPPLSREHLAGAASAGATASVSSASAPPSSTGSVGGASEGASFAAVFAADAELAAATALRPSPARAAAGSSPSPLFAFSPTPSEPSRAHRRGAARAEAAPSSVQALQGPLPRARPARDLVARCLEADTAFIRAASAERAGDDVSSDHGGGDSDADVIPDTLERPAAVSRRAMSRADVLEATVRDFIADWRDEVARRDLLNAALEAAALPPPRAAIGTQTALRGDDVAAMAAAPAALAAQAAAELAEHAAMLEDAEAAHELDMADLQDMHQAELDRMEQGCRTLLHDERAARAAAEAAVAEAKAAAADAQREASATAQALRQSVADLSAQLAQVKATNEAAAKQVCDAQAAADAARADAEAARADAAAERDRAAAALATRDELARLMHCGMALSQQCLGVSLPPAPPDAAKTVRLALADVSHSSRANA